jgi:hypothetical protein
MQPKPKEKQKFMTHEELTTTWDYQQKREIIMKELNSNQINIDKKSFVKTILEKKEIKKIKQAFKNEMFLKHGFMWRQILNQIPPIQFKAL